MYYIQNRSFGKYYSFKISNHVNFLEKLCLSQGDRHLQAAHDTFGDHCEKLKWFSAFWLHASPVNSIKGAYDQETDEFENGSKLTVVDHFPESNLSVFTKALEQRSEGLTHHNADKKMLIVAGTLFFVARIRSELIKRLSGDFFSVFKVFINRYPETLCHDSVKVAFAGLDTNTFVGPIRIA